MNVLINDRPEHIPLRAACRALGINRSSVYAKSGRSEDGRSRKGAAQPRALSPQERERIIATMDSDEFCNQPPSEIYQTLLERGVHLCSVNTMHRLLRQRGEHGERRAQRAPQHHAVSRLVAQAPNKVLYRIERQATAQELTPEQRWALRQAHARPLMAQFKDWLESHHPSVLPKSTLGKAFHYALVRWDGFCAYLDDGRIEIDNNLTEQQVKPFVIARKNFLFAHSVAGANALCVHFSLIRTAKQHGLDPYRYYGAILKAVPHCQRVEDYEALLPWNMTSEAGAVSARAA